VNVRRNADDDEPFGGGFSSDIPFANPVTGETSDRVDVHEYDDQVTVAAELPVMRYDAVGSQLFVENPRLQLSNEDLW